MKSQSANLRAVGIVTLAFAVFSLSDAFVKWLSQSLPVAQVTFMISCFALALVVVQALVTKSLADIIPRYPTFAMTRALLLAGDSVLIFYAFSTLPLAEVYVLAFMTPILVAVLAFLFLKERLSLLAACGVVLGFIGVLIAFRPGVATLGLGHMAAIASVTMFAVSLLMLRRAKAEESDMALVATTLLFLAIIAFGVVIAGPGFQVVSPSEFAIAGFDGLCLFAGHSLLVRAFRMGDASVLSPFQYSQILWGGLLGYLLFSEPVEMHTIIGAVIIILSGWLVLK
jgi:S-adenosylmethionine uptake transporter